MTAPAPTVLVPAYRPGPALLQTLADLRSARPDWGLVVVDDGSGPAYAALVDAARATGAEILTLPVNRGKGAALKAGFAHVAATRPGAPVVCADADGQHAVGDIVAIGERLLAAPDLRRLVLGTRTFDARVPLRSRIGNTVTRWLFTAATRSRVTDTQTGLRGIPADLLGWACSVPGERYEYELQVLLRAGRAGIALDPVPIATIYLDDNASSHFRPVTDSLRVYVPLLAFLASSLAAFAIDTVALLLLTAATGDLLLSVVGARLTSAGVNFVVNRRLVFVSARRHRTRGAVRSVRAPRDGAPRPQLPRAQRTHRPGPGPAPGQGADRAGAGLDELRGPAPLRLPDLATAHRRRTRSAHLRDRCAGHPRHIAHPHMSATREKELP